jgi:hypothetical protein
MIALYRNFSVYSYRSAVKVAAGKYDYRYSKLVLVLARLINKGWIDFSDLEGLAEDKMDRVESLINFWNE